MSVRALVCSVMSPIKGADMKLALGTSVMTHPYKNKTTHTPTCTNMLAVLAAALKSRISSFLKEQNRLRLGLVRPSSARVFAFADQIPDR